MGVRAGLLFQFQLHFGGSQPFGESPLLVRLGPFLPVVLALRVFGGPSKARQPPSQSPCQREAPVSRLSSAHRKGRCRQSVISTAHAQGSGATRFGLEATCFLAPGVSPTTTPSSVLSPLPLDLALKVALLFRGLCDCADQDLEPFRGPLDYS